jgi:protein-tyrosine-phosphatase
VETWFDKVKTRKLANRLGIPIADGILFAPGDDADGAIERIGLPMVLKPTCSYRLDNLQVRDNVFVAFTRQDALERLSAANQRQILLESYFEGVSVGVSALAENGDTLRLFQHIRVHPLKSGSSAYRKSEALDERLANACKALIRQLHYTGLVMCEFRMNPKSREWILLECNARPWGSLPLPVALGVNFPFWWMRLLLEGRRPEDGTYPVGRFARNLTGDVHFLLQQWTLHRGQWLKRLRISGSWFGGLLRPLAGREFNDTFVVDDPTPAFDEFKTLISRLRRKLWGRSVSRGPRFLLQELTRSSASMRAPFHIEFVCLGNICRSPYAEELLRQCLPPTLGRIITMGSSGSLSREGRPAPAEAIERAAQRKGIDLKSHRSRHLTYEQAEGSDVIFVFDQRNEHDVLSLYPDTAKKIIWLGDFIGGGRRSRSIDDPYGKGGAAFDRSFGDIELAVNGLVSMLVDALDDFSATSSPELVRSRQARTSSPAES